MKCLFFVFFCLVQVLDKYHHLLALRNAYTEFCRETCASDCLLLQESCNVIAYHNIQSKHCFVRFLRKFRSKLPWLYVAIPTDVEIIKVNSWNWLLNSLQPSDLHYLTWIKIHELLFLLLAWVFTYTVVARTIIFHAIATKKLMFIMTSRRVVIHTDIAFTRWVWSIDSRWACSEFQKFRQHLGSTFLSWSIG